MTNPPESVVCPDCNNPIKTHRLYKGGLCPVVVVKLPPESAEERFVRAMQEALRNRFDHESHGSEFTRLWNEAIDAFADARCQGMASKMTKKEWSDFRAHPHETCRAELRRRIGG